MTDVLRIFPAFVGGADGLLLNAFMSKRDVSMERFFHLELQMDCFPDCIFCSVE